MEDITMNKTGGSSFILCFFIFLFEFVFIYRSI